MTKNFNSLVEEWKGKLMDAFINDPSIPTYIATGRDLESFLEQAMLAAAEGAAEAGAVEKADHVKRGKNKNHSNDEVYCCIECFEDDKFNAAISQSQSQLSAYFENHD